VKALRKSELFDESWYLEQYPDVAMLGLDPLEHYLWIGAKLGRRPSPSWEKFIAEWLDQLNIAIKCPAPNLSVAHQWGDYHFARSLSRSLETFGCKVRVDLLCDWDNVEQHPGDDVVLVLRGLGKYQPRPGPTNLLWLISHPDDVSVEEMQAFDHVFVASDSFCTGLRPTLGTKVSSLLQCSDPELFDQGSEPSCRKEIDMAFVGNSRRVDRWMPALCAERGLPLQVYGADWEGRIPAVLIKGDHIPNDQLGKFYNSCKIVLNDHWPDMARNGFISNRIFDAGLSGALVISDKFAGSEIFSGNIICCEDGDDVEMAVRHYLHSDEERFQKVSNMRDLVLMNHTFDHRAKEIIRTIEALHWTPSLPPISR